MALRLRKSFKIAPGVRLNVSKSGFSASVGGKGLTANLSKRGTKVTTGIPGTGISTSKLYASKKKWNAEQVQQSTPSNSWRYVVIVVFVLALLAWIF